MGIPCEPQGTTTQGQVRNQPARKSHRELCTACPSQPASHLYLRVFCLLNKSDFYIEATRLPNPWFYLNRCTQLLYITQIFYEDHKPPHHQITARFRTSIMYLIVPQQLHRSKCRSYTQSCESHRDIASLGYSKGLLIPYTEPESGRSQQ